MRFTKTQDYSKAVEKLNLIDDELFRKVAEDKGAIEDVLRIILEDDKLQVIETHQQESITNLLKKSPVLDALCKDSKGRLFDVEVQKEDKDDHQRRLRFGVSSIDARNIEKGVQYKDLPDVYAIMISAFDIFKEGKTVYHINRSLDSSNKKQDNGIHEIYVNAKGKGGGPVAELMEYFINSKGVNPNFKRLSERVEYYKTDEKGSGQMSDIVKQLTEEARAEGMAQGIAAGVAQGRAEGVAQGKSEVLKVLNISEEEYQALLAKQAQ